MLDTITYRLTIKEVADRLNVCDRTIRNRMKLRREAANQCAKMVGRKWRFSEAVFASDLALAG